METYAERIDRLDQEDGVCWVSFLDTNMGKTVQGAWNRAMKSHSALQSKQGLDLIVWTTNKVHILVEVSFFHTGESFVSVLRNPQ